MSQDDLCLLAWAHSQDHQGVGSAWLDWMAVPWSACPAPAALVAAGD